MCADRLISKDGGPPVVSIHTVEQATNYVEKLTVDVLDMRAMCDQLVKRTGTPEQAVKRAFWIYMKKYGEVIGALNTLRMTGMIPERAWVELHQKVINTLTPTVVVEGT